MNRNVRVGVTDVLAMLDVPDRDRLAAEGALAMVLRLAASQRRGGSCLRVPIPPWPSLDLSRDDRDRHHSGPSRPHRDGGVQRQPCHLISTPHLWGATWQARVGDGFAPDVGGRIQSGLLADPWVQNLAAGGAAQLELDDRVRVDAFAMDALRGGIEPLALSGRGRAAADEIPLGTAALRSLGAHIGDEIKVSVGPRSAAFRVVGRGPLPLGAFRDAGHSAMINFQALERLVPGAQPNIYLVDGPAGTTPSVAARLPRRTTSWHRRLPARAANGLCQFWTC